MLTKIMAMLPQLSQQELATVRAACDQLIKGPVEAQDETSPLYDAMADLLGVRLCYRDFCNVTAYRSWRKHAPAVVDFIVSLYPDVSSAAKRAIMLFLLGALRDDLKERGVPITLGTMANNMDRLPEVYDECFPGYREAGLQKLVLEAMEHKGG